MTAAATTLRADAKVIGLVGLAHGFSHFFQLVLPPLFPLIREDLGTSYAALGAVMAVFYTVSGITQTVAGFLVDRLGARSILLAGMALISLAAVLAGFAPSLPWLFAAAVIGGIGNSVFHPADFALLNARVDPRRLGYAFSVHGIVGNVGWALAPVFVFPIAQAYGWRTGTIAAGALGFLCLAVLATQRSLGDSRPPAPRAAAPARRGGFAQDVRLLASAPILLCFGFFALYSITLVGFQTFSTAALTKLYDIPLALATTALTAFLLGGAAGILAGGFIAVRTDRHGLVAVSGMVIPAALSLWIASAAVAPAMVVAVMTAAGFAFGAMGPSRDIIVRGIAPEHSRGKVYGFVYSGLDLGGLIGPLLFGFFLDQGRPAMIFTVAAVVMILAVPTVVWIARAPARVRPV